jgi:hypothetical protein
LEVSSFGSDCGVFDLSRRCPSCFLIVLLTRKAPTVPQANAWLRAIGKLLLRGNAENEIPVTPRNTAIGAAAAAACPGLLALYTNCTREKD